MALDITFSASVSILILTVHNRFVWLNALKRFSQTIQKDFPARMGETGKWVQKLPAL